MGFLIKVKSKNNSLHITKLLGENFVGDLSVDEHVNEKYETTGYAVTERLSGSGSVPLMTIVGDEEEARTYVKKYFDVID